MSTERVFLHAQTHDGEFESVCPDCHTLVCAEFDESDLGSRENVHICDLNLLRRLWSMRKFF